MNKLLTVSHKQGAIQKTITIAVPALEKDWDNFIAEAKKVSVKTRVRLAKDFHLIFPKGADASVEIHKSNKTETYHNVFEGIAAYLEMEVKDLFHTGGGEDGEGKTA